MLEYIQPLFIHNHCLNYETFDSLRTGLYCPSKTPTQSVTDIDCLPCHKPILSVGITLADWSQTLLSESKGLSRALTGDVYDTTDKEIGHYLNYDLQNC